MQAWDHLKKVTHKEREEAALAAVRHWQGYLDTAQALFDGATDWVTNQQEICSAAYAQVNFKPGTPPLSQGGEVLRNFLLPSEAVAMLRVLANK